MDERLQNFYRKLKLKTYALQTCNKQKIVVLVLECHFVLSRTADDDIAHVYSLYTHTHTIMKRFLCHELEYLQRVDVNLKRNLGFWKK